MDQEKDCLKKSWQKDLMLEEEKGRLVKKLSTNLAGKY